jgi:outer membrane protein OmpA-like peptidoglycan-associated protein
MRIVTVAVLAALPLLAAGCAKGSKPAPALVPSTAARPPVCMDFSFPIYFDLNSGQLTEAARTVVDDAAQRVKGCVLGRIDVVGLADASGGAGVNMTVSRRRAQTVADALSRAGLPRPTFDIDAVGSAGALTPEGQPEPLRRRTEVVIRASAPPAPPPPAPNR